MLVSEPFNLPRNPEELLRTPPPITRQLEIRAQTAATPLEELNFSFEREGTKFDVTVPKTRSFPHFTLYKTARVEPRIQNGTTCGPTSVLMALDSLQVKSSLTEVCDAVKYNSFIGTSPISIKEAAGTFGIKASIRQNVTPTGIANILDAHGIGIALIERGNGLHYVVVNGIRESRERGTELSIVDPNGSGSGWKSWESFSQSWDSVNWRGFETGLSRCLIVFGKDKIVENDFDGQALKYSTVHSNICKFFSFLQSAFGLIERIIGILAGLTSNLDQGALSKTRESEGDHSPPL